MTTRSRIFTTALAACAFAGPALATGDPGADTATATTTPTKPSEIVTVMDCEPAVDAACTATGDASVAQPVLDVPGGKQPPVDSQS